MDPRTLFIMGLIGALTFFYSSAPLLASPSDDKEDFGLVGAWYFYDNPTIDDNDEAFMGVRWRFGDFNLGLDTNTVLAAMSPSTLANPGPSPDELTFLYLNYLFYISEGVYCGAGPIARYGGSDLDDAIGFDVVLGFDLDEQWNLEGKYVQFESSDSAWVASFASFPGW